MALPNLGRGGLPVYSPAASTLSITNGTTAANFTGTAFLATDANGVTVPACGTGDVLVVSGIGRMEIESVTDNTHLTLCAPWPAATQTNTPATVGVAGASGWYIIRNNVPATGSVAKAIQDALALGSEASPNGAYVVDDTTARVTLRLKRNKGVISVAPHPTGSATASYLDAIFFDPLTGEVTINRNTADLPPLDPAFAPTFHIGAADGAGANLVIDHFGTNSSRVLLRGARGTLATKTPNQAGDFLGAFGGYGYGVSAYQPFGGAGILPVAAENFTDTAGGTDLQFYSTSTGTITSAVRGALRGSTFIFGNIPATSYPTDALLLLNSNTGAVIPGNGRGANERWPYQIVLADGTPGGLGIDAVAYGPGAAYGSGPANVNAMWAGAFGVFDFRRTNGTLASPLPLKGGDLIGVHGGLGYAGGGYAGPGGSQYSWGAVQMRFFADGDWSATNQPTRIDFLNTPPGADSLGNVPYMRLQKGLRLGGGMTATDTPGANDPGDGVVWAYVGYKGSTTGLAPAAGLVGEVQRATPVASPGTTLTNNTETALISMTLGPGVWEIIFNPTFRPGATTAVGFLLSSINSGTNGDYSNTENFTAENFPSSYVMGNVNQRYNLTRIMNLTVSTTVKGFVLANFVPGTLTCWGSLYAVRIA